MHPIPFLSSPLRGSSWAASPRLVSSKRRRIQPPARSQTTSVKLPSSRSKTRDESYSTPLLDLPRHVPASKGLLLVSQELPGSHWPSHLERADDVYGDIERSAQALGIRVLGYHRQGQRQSRLLLPGETPLELPSPSDIPDYLRSSDFSEWLATKPDPPATPTWSRSVIPAAHQEAEIVICTHGARDCRCSDIGGDLVHALRSAIRESPDAAIQKMRVSEVSHMGGHKFAANVILLPSLHLLGNLRPTHAPLLLDLLAVQNSPNPNRTHSEITRSFWKEHFRGSFGRTIDEQAILYQSSIVAPASSTPSTERLLAERATLKIRFTDWEGKKHDVLAREGETLMDVAKREELGAVEGACGGHLECATCHVYLPSPPQCASVESLSDEEEDMLGYAIGYREGSSRLGCQIEVTKELSQWSMQGEGAGLPRW